MNEATGIVIGGTYLSAKQARDDISELSGCLIAQPDTAALVLGRYQDERRGLLCPNAVTFVDDVPGITRDRCRPEIERLLRPSVGSGGVRLVRWAEAFRTDRYSSYLWRPDNPSQWK